MRRRFCSFRENTLFFKMACCMLLFIGEHHVKQGVDESNAYVKEQPVASCNFLVKPRLACFVKGEEVICQRACKGSVAKQDSLLMNAFCVKLHICIMKMAILKKPSQKWSIVPGKPSAKLCRKHKTGVWCDFLSAQIGAMRHCHSTAGR